METYRAKIFRNGGSQAVRLPKELRFEGADVICAYRQGGKVVLERLDEWPESWQAALGSWTEEIERPDQPRLDELADPFG
jgi:antitoxin VapB